MTSMELAKAAANNAALALNASRDADSVKEQAALAAEGNGWATLSMAHCLIQVHEDESL